MTHQTPGPDPRDTLSFQPATPRARIDGWTVAKQREFVEALADCGIVRQAAAQVGMSEQGVSRLRRRADGAAFSRACDVAVQLARARVHSIAWDRVLNGTIKQHFYHGELKGEERVFDNRLLANLLGRLDSAARDGPSTAELEREWSGILDRLEDDPPPGMEADESLWEEDGLWCTDFPPPEGFAGTEHGSYGDPGYRRHLSQRESEALDREETDEMRAWLEAQYRRRDRFFGFAGGRDFSGHWDAEPSEPSKSGETELSEPSEPAETAGSCETCGPSDPPEGAEPSEPAEASNFAEPSEAYEPPAADGGGGDGAANHATGPP